MLIVNNIAIQWKEEGSWKIDLTAMFPVTEPVFRALIKGSGLEENDFLTMIIGQMVGDEKALAAWHPLK